MIIKLRELNGTYYMRIGKEIKEAMEIGGSVDIKIENGKIVVSKVVDKVVDNVDKI